MARPRSYPDDLRERLVAAATERLSVAPPDQLSMRELAASQNTSTNAIYSIFGGKQAVVDAVVAQANEEFMARQRQALAGGPTVESLVQLGTAYRQWAVTNPAMYRLMFENPGLAVPGASSGSLGPLVVVVEHLVAQDILRDEPVDAICRALWVATHGAVLLEMSERIHPAAGEAIYREIQRLVLIGLLTDPGLAPSFEG